MEQDLAFFERTLLLDMGNLVYFYIEKIHNHS